MRDTGALRQSTICTFASRSMKPRLPTITSRLLPFSLRRRCAKYGDVMSTGSERPPPSRERSAARRVICSTSGGRSSARASLI
jgi:hypothetical protein